MNTKAAALLARIKQQDEELIAIQHYWQALFTDLPIPQPVTVRAWLQRYDFDVVVAGLDAALIQASKRLEGKPMNQGQVVNYASATMRDIHRGTLPPEEQERLKHSEVRSKAAKARWNRANVAAKKEETQNLHQDALVSTDLHEVGCALHTAYACSLSHANATASALAPESKPAAAAPPVPHPVKKEQEQNQNQKPTPAAHAGAKQERTKTAKDGTPYPDGFDSWGNVRRLDWLYDHTPTSTNSPDSARPQTKVKFESLIGSVEELE